MGDSWFAFGRYEQMDEEVSSHRDYWKDCAVCGRSPEVTPMAYQNEPWCSEQHRQVHTAEREPTKAEWDTMAHELFERLKWVWEKK